MSDLYTERHSGNEILNLAELDSDEVISNLMEDVKCLNEDIQKLQAENAELKGQSQWISVDDELPEDKVLISFLEQSFLGSYYQEVGVGYYDAPDHYENPEDATGWRFWIPDRPVVGKGVTHWMPLPTPPEGE